MNVSGKEKCLVSHQNKCCAYCQTLDIIMLMFMIIWISFTLLIRL